MRAHPEFGVRWPYAPGMDIEVLTIAIGLASVLLLSFGRDQIAKGSNAPIANGVVALVLATILGIGALGMLASRER